MRTYDITVKCVRCRHQCMESAWKDKPVPMFGDIKATQKVCPKCGCRSYYDMRPQVAWCWASGLIETGDVMPENTTDGSGPILIAKGPKAYLVGVLSGTARIGRGGQMLVPGVPEALGDIGKVDALKDWHAWCAKGNGLGHRNGVEFVIDVKPNKAGHGAGATHAHL